MNKITLFQPRHTFADEGGDGHIYLPSSICTVAGRILAAGGDVEIQDANLHKPKFTSPIIGANIVGAPYIPIAIDLRKEITKQLGDEAKLILGGQVINGLDQNQFQRLFGDNVYNGNNDVALKKLLGMELRAFPRLEQTSLIPAYKKISDADFQRYLEREFCLYLSQGCKYACDFCAAVRTRKDPLTGQIIQVREQYRDLKIVDEELRHMVKRALSLGIKSFEIYLSNLDTFQTPEKLKEFAQIVLAIKKDHPGFVFRMRGLSTASTFVDTYKDDPETIELIQKAGLWSIGFGVDGASKEIWKSIKKGHNQKDECIDAIRICREEFGITPEIFMVIGHQADTEETLQDAINFTLDMHELYDAAPRPYIAKSIVPGNSGWSDPKNVAIVEQLISHPELFNLLEYSALPTSLTHDRAGFRKQIEKAFFMMTQIPGNTTSPVYPISPDHDQATNELHARLNRGKFDR